MTSTDASSTREHGTGEHGTREHSTRGRGRVRRTRQQSAVAGILAEQDDFRSAQQIHERLRASGETVGLATVYRTLQAMNDSGEVDAIRSPEGEQLYRRCASEQHHHHLVCDSCGRTVEVTGPAMERWLETLAAEHGFSELHHDLEIFGTCRSCG